MIVDAQAARHTARGRLPGAELAAQIFHTDGFRPDSDFDRGTFAGRWAVDLSPTLGISVPASIAEKAIRRPT